MLMGYVLASSALHWLVNILDLDGLISFLVYCVPLLVVISYTTIDDNENFWNAMRRNALYGYSMIIAVAGLAWFIGSV